MYLMMTKLLSVHVVGDNTKQLGIQCFPQTFLRLHLRQLFIHVLYKKGQSIWNVVSLCSTLLQGRSMMTLAGPSECYQVPAIHTFFQAFNSFCTFKWLQIKDKQ